MLAKIGDNAAEILARGIFGNSGGNARKFLKRRATRRPLLAQPVSQGVGKAYTYTLPWYKYCPPFARGHAQAQPGTLG